MHNPSTEVLIFKTNIRFKKHLNTIRTHIETEPKIIKWNVDLKDIDKVLRIESFGLQPAVVENIVQSAGYYCKELGD